MARKLECDECGVIYGIHEGFTLKTKADDRIEKGSEMIFSTASWDKEHHWCKDCVQKEDIKTLVTALGYEVKIISVLDFSPGLNNHARIK